MIVKILVGSLLVLSTVNVFAGDLYIYKDKEGQTLLTNANPNGHFDKFNKKAKTTYYRDAYSPSTAKHSKKVTENPQPRVKLSEEEKSLYLAMADDDGSLYRSLKEK